MRGLPDKNGLAYDRHRLALACPRGPGVARDPAEAAGIFGPASEPTSFGPSPRALARLPETGEGVARDRGGSLRPLEKAAFYGDARARPAPADACLESGGRENVGKALVRDQARGVVNRVTRRRPTRPFGGGAPDETDEEASPVPARSAASGIAAEACFRAGLTRLEGPGGEKRPSLARHLFRLTSAEALDMERRRDAELRGPDDVRDPGAAPRWDLKSSRKTRPATPSNLPGKRRNVLAAKDAARTSSKPCR
ncbi:MAG: hypothetical protein LBO05_08745 [Deltaproteobacteria bacterium]|nr:hypothetical protein [Deltaproteobacteria bacterium]